MYFLGLCILIVVKALFVNLLFQLNENFITGNAALLIIHILSGCLICTGFALNKPFDNPIMLYYEYCGAGVMAMVTLLFCAGVL